MRCLELILNRLSIALELAKHNPTYEDIASKVGLIAFFTVEALMSPVL